MSAKRAMLYIHVTDGQITRWEWIGAKTALLPIDRQFEKALPQWSAMGNCRLRKVAASPEALPYDTLYACADGWLFFSWLRHWLRAHAMQAWWASVGPVLRFLYRHRLGDWPEGERWAWRMFWRGLWRRWRPGARCPS